MTIDLLITAENCRPTLDAFRQNFEVHFLPDAPNELAMLDKVRPKIRAILTSTSYGATREFIESFPALEIICCFGAGYDGLNVEAIRDRNLAFTTAVGTNADGVADLALAHILACTRRIPMADKYVRSDRWATEGRLPLRHSLSGKHLGIIGLGAIGSRVAKRAGGFDMKVAYTGPNQKNVPYAFEEKLIDLAHFADFLVACCPGGPKTHGIVTRDVLVALGPNGTFINVARASVVNQSALIEVLTTGKLGAAGLDLFDGAPTPPKELVKMENVVFTPHIGGRCIESFDNAVVNVLTNLKNHFRGQPLITPVPGFEGKATDLQ